MKNLSCQDFHPNTSGINTYLHEGLEHYLLHQTLFFQIFTESKQKGLWILAGADLLHVAEQVLVHMGFFLSNLAIVEPPQVTRWLES